MAESALPGTEMPGTDTGRYPIASGGYRAELVATGAGLRLFERDWAGRAWPLTESWPAGTRPPLSAGLVLAPWPNRIAGGRFYFDGIDHELEITEPARDNASHGLVRRRDWTLVEHTASRVTQAIDVGLHKGWPYPMRLSVTHDLGVDGLTVTHTATNTGAVPAPYGLGVHTFVRAGDAPLDDCLLTLPAGVRLPTDPARMLPAGPPEPVRDTEFDFGAARSLRGVWLDTPFSSLGYDYDGRARAVLRPPDGPATVLWIDTDFRWIQVFTADPAHDQAYPNRGRALAVEPMTCPPDAFNSGIDQIVLAPGQTWSAQWGMSSGE